MAPRQSKPEQVKSLEATLWEAADRLRSRVDAAEYKHVVLGLIFLKYVSDVFAKRRETLERLVDDPDGDYFMPTPEAKASVVEDRDEYTSEGVFWMPEGHRAVTACLQDLRDLDLVVTFAGASNPGKGNTRSNARNTVAHGG